MSHYRKTIGKNFSVDFSNVNSLVTWDRGLGLGGVNISNNFSSRFWSTVTQPELEFECEQSEFGNCRLGSVNIVLYNQKR